MTVKTFPDMKAISHTALCTHLVLRMTRASLDDQLDRSTQTDQEPKISERYSKLRDRRSRSCPPCCTSAADVHNFKIQLQRAAYAESHRRTLKEKPSEWLERTTRNKVFSRKKHMQRSKNRTETKEVLGNESWNSYVNFVRTQLGKHKIDIHVWKSLQKQNQSNPSKQTKPLKALERLNPVPQILAQATFYANIEMSQKKFGLAVHQDFGQFLLANVTHQWDSKERKKRSKNFKKLLGCSNPSSAPI